jgi:thioredoxin reductase (NADPH)
MQISTKTQPEVKTQTQPINKDEYYDIAIIGGGPAGLSAGIYSLRQGHNTVLIEKAIAGGAILSTFEIENYPGFTKAVTGQELASRMEEQAKNLGLKSIWGEVIKIENSATFKKISVDDKIIIAKAVIIATGTESKKMGIPGEEEFRGRGVSYCAICDGPFYKDKDVAVVGGGNAAVEEALFLTKFCKKVFIVHRRNKLRADQYLANKAKANPKIYFHWDSVVENIGGKSCVENISIKNIKNNQSSIIKTNGVFIYIGKNPNTAFCRNLIKLNQYGAIITDHDMKTSIEGIFAAGDVREKSLYQVVTAAADGAIAAVSAAKFIDSNF